MHSAGGTCVERFSLEVKDGRNVASPSPRRGRWAVRGQTPRGTSSGRIAARSRARHPVDMAEAEINAFVTHLPVTEHVAESLLQKASSRAAISSGFVKRARSHSLRRSFTAHLLENGHDIRTVQSRICGIEHSDVHTTVVHAHIVS